MSIAIYWLVLVLYLGQAIATSRIAKRKGREHVIWLWYSAVAPGVALIHALLLMDTREHQPTS